MLTEAGTTDVIVQLEEFSEIKRVVETCEPFTHTVKMFSCTGEDEVFAKRLNGTVTDAVEAVPDVAPVKLTGEGACTCQVQPLVVKFMAKLRPVAPEDGSIHT